MMKNKVLAYAYTLITGVAFILGLVGNIRLNAPKTNGAGMEGNRLIGVFLTKESLSKLVYDEPDIRFDSLEEALASFSNPVLFAEEVNDEHEFRFPVEGYMYIDYIWEEDGYPCHFSYAEGPFTDIHCNNSVSDTERKTSNEITVFCNATGEENHWYVNLIYETDDGRVYAVSSHSLIRGGGDGVNWSQSQTYNVTKTYTEKQGLFKPVLEKHDEYEVVLKMSNEFTAKSVCISILDDDLNLISRKEYAVEDLPESINRGDDTNLIVVECLMDTLQGPKKETKVYTCDDSVIDVIVPLSDGLAGNNPIIIE